MVTGAGGNKARANTDKEYYETCDLDNPAIGTVFDLSTDAMSGAFDLNFLGTIVPTQAFVPHMLGRKGICIPVDGGFSAFSGV